MKFDVKTFVRQADAAFSVAKESALVPIFEYVLIAAFDDGATITATNSAHTVRVVAQCEEPPLKAFCLHAAAIWPILKSLDGTAEITRKGATATLRCGGVSMNIPALDHKEFPDTPKHDGRAAMEVDLEAFLKVLADMSFFMAHDDGLAPGRQNLLVGDRGVYAFDNSAGAVCALYLADTPFIIPPAVRSVLSKFSGKWQVFPGAGYVLFKQGEQFYRRKHPEFAADKAIPICHSVIANAATAPAIASFEAARIAPAVARAVLAGAIDVHIEGAHGSITILARNEVQGAVLEEVIPSDGVVFKTCMRAKQLQGVLEIAGYGGTVVVSGQTATDKADWPPSLLIKNSERKFMAIVGPVMTK